MRAVPSQRVFQRMIDDMEPLNMGRKLSKPANVECKIPS